MLEALCWTGSFHRGKLHVLCGVPQNKATAECHQISTLSLV